MNQYKDKADIESGNQRKGYFLKLVFSLSVVILLFATHYFVVPFFYKDDYKNLSLQTGDSTLDTFVRKNFGFGLAITDEETERFNIVCNEYDAPKNRTLKRNSSYITCHNDGDAWRVFIGWKNYSYDRLDYARDVGTTIMKVRGDMGTGEFSCTEDRTFAWDEKMPATISDCNVKTDNQIFYYSILFFYPSKVRDTNPTIVIANIVKSDPSVNDKLRDFIKRIQSIQLATGEESLSERISMIETAYAGGGGGGAGAGVGVCGPGSAAGDGCGGSAGASGGGGDAGFGGG
ncbi:MAG: hypothetical protein K9M46_04165, partial [Candidatus Pacebacteria bacterium]|nr:hypothetical protein [Candidatus Paceibacterota bacterium]